MLKQLLLLFAIFFQLNKTAKILIISPPISNSLVLYKGRIADILVQNGHNVVCKL